MKYVCATLAIAGALFASSAQAAAPPADLGAQDVIGVGDNTDTPQQALSPIAPTTAPATAPTAGSTTAQSTIDVIHPAPPSVAFDVAGVSFRASTPPGYCEPAGPLVKMSQAMANYSSRNNLTNAAVWVACAARQDDIASLKFAVLGASLSVVPPGVTPAQAIRLLAAQVTGARFQEGAKSKISEGARAAGGTASLQGHAVIAAMDARALYIRVQAEIAKSAVTLQMRAIEGITVIDHRVIVVLFGKFATPDEPDDDLLAAARAEIAHITQGKGASMR